MSKEIGIESYYDVAVIGGGAVGLGYAIRVKRDNPELRVLVVEKAKEPRFKIGESTLSVTVENLLELGFTMPQLRRLFTVKSGLGFWYTDSAADELVSRSTFATPRRHSRSTAGRWKSRSPSSPSRAGWRSGPEQASPRAGRGWTGRTRCS